MKLRWIYLISLLILLMLLGGCARKYRLTSTDGETESAWPFHRGSLGSTGYAVSPDFNGQLKTIWSKRRSGKPAGPLTIYFGNILYPSAKGRIRVLRLADGSYRGRFRPKGVAQTGVNVVDSIAIYGLAPKENRLLAVNLYSGRELWDMKVKDASPGSIIKGERYIVGSSDGIVSAIAVSTGKIAWDYDIEQRLTAPLSATQEVLFVPGNEGTLFALATEDGHEIWKTKLDGPLVSAVAVSQQVVVATMSGEVYALNLDDGSVIWRNSVGGPVWTAPAVGDGRVFVGNSHGYFFALDLPTGKMLWQNHTSEVIRAAPTVVGEYVLVGTMTGRLYSLNVVDGSIRDQVLLDGGIVQAPITDGQFIVVATEKGNLSCFGSNDAEHEDYRVQEGYDKRVDFRH